MAVAMHSQMNIGQRHLLPIYPFLYLFAAAAAVYLISINKRWSYALIVLFLWQVVTSVRVAPGYMAYANEAWGGPSATHKYLSDANTDWGQQLKAVKHYLDSRGIKDCWFAYFPDGVIEPGAYGIPCKRLPTVETLWWLHSSMDVPPEIDGPVLISDSDLASIEFGQGKLNPYEQFRHIKPIAVIQYGLFVYNGHFQIPLASALFNAAKAQTLLSQNQVNSAFAAAQEAVALAPDSAQTQTTLGDVLAKLGRKQEAQARYEAALTAAQTIEPSLQEDLIPGLKAKIAGLAATH